MDVLKEWLLDFCVFGHDGTCLMDRCVEDKPWMCQGESDHIGKIGAVKSCPSKQVPPILPIVTLEHT